MPEHETITSPADLHRSLVPLIDSNGNELIEEGATASAVNHFKVTNAAGTNSPELAAMGSATDLDVKITGKGTGNVLANGVNVLLREIGIACSDETTDLTTGTAKATFRMPYAMTLTEVRASVTTAPTGAALQIDINENGTTIFSTEPTIDAGEKTTATAATPSVLSDTALADDSEITVDIVQVGSTIAGAGLKVWLIGVRVS